jgi:hypothetical protein
MRPNLFVEGPTELLGRLLDALGDRYSVVPVSLPLHEHVWRLCFEFEVWSDKTSDEFDKQSAFRQALEILDHIATELPGADLKRTLLIPLSITLADIWNSSAYFSAGTAEELARRGCGIWVTASLVSDS